MQEDEIQEKAAANLQGLNTKLSDLLSCSIFTLSTAQLREHNEQLTALLAAIDLYKRILSESVSETISSAQIPGAAYTTPFDVDRPTTYIQDGIPPPSGPQADISLSRSQMLPPPELSFPSESALRAYCDTWAFDHGYDLVKRGSSGPGKWHYHCGRAGVTQNTRNIAPENIRRKRTTRKCGCEVKMYIVCENFDSPEEEQKVWSLKHYKTMAMHNHDPTPVGKRKLRVPRPKRVDDAGEDEEDRLNPEASEVQGDAASGDQPWTTDRLL